MSDQLGPDFDDRLRTALDPFEGPTPSPDRARFGGPPRRRSWLGGARPALATAGVVAAVTVAASALSGSASPAVWTHRAMTTVESITGGSESSPSAEPTSSPHSASQPSAHAEPTEPNHESPEPSGETNQQPPEGPTVSPSPSPERDQPPGASPSPSSTPDGGDHESPSPSPSG